MKDSSHTFAQQNTLVVCPLLPHQTYQNIDPQARLKEAVGLAQAVNLQVLEADSVVLKKIRANMLLGQGTVERIAASVKTHDIQVIIVDSALTPVQQRNLEKTWNCKVIDRTGLILEIFGARAKTKEGGLQVELAALEYQKSRLVKSWSHLERQRGGLGTIGGPGETQLEVDRRLIGERIIKLKQDLEKVKYRRSTQRRARHKVPFPIIALVGYTNAGKSTLFNTLTSANVLAQDLLFATLDPTMRQLKLPFGEKAILSDTVGFISDLPTQLISAFQATLEEVQAADIILHVQDISHPYHHQQAEDVKKVLKDLGIDSTQFNVIDVLNKIDCLEKEDYSVIVNDHPEKTIAVSALKNIGLDILLNKISTILGSRDSNYHFQLEPNENKQAAWLYQHGRVIEQSYDHTGQNLLTVTLSGTNYNRYKDYFKIKN